jgi:hypothetical protein
MPAFRLDHREESFCEDAHYDEFCIRVLIRRLGGASLPPVSI